MKVTVFVILCVGHVVGLRPGVGIPLAGCRCVPLPRPTTRRTGAKAYLNVSTVNQFLSIIFLVWGKIIEKII